MNDHDFIVEYLKSERHPIVIGVDPGLSIGISEFGIVGIPPTPQITWKAQGHRVEAIEWLRSRLNLFFKVDVSVLVAVERYVESKKRVKTWEPDALQVQGAVREQCETLGHLYVELPPAYSKKIASNDRLRALDWWTRPGEVMQPDANDVNDAHRVTLAALATYHSSVFERLMSSIMIDPTKIPREI